MMKAPHGKMIISDLGCGMQHHQYIGLGHILDMKFRLNEEFNFYHPMLLENAKVGYRKGINPPTYEI